MIWLSQQREARSHYSERASSDEFLLTTSSHASDTLNYVKAQAHFRTADSTPRCTTHPNVASILSNDSAPCQSTSKFKTAAQPRDVALRRRAEQLLIVAAEICRVFVAHSVPRARRVQVLAEHQLARLL